MLCRKNITEQGYSLTNNLLFDRILSTLLRVNKINNTDLS